MEEEYKKFTAEDKSNVVQAGGLMVVGTERHESRRIDNQLRGRSGRYVDRFTPHVQMPPLFHPITHPSIHPPPRSLTHASTHPCTHPTPEVLVSALASSL